ncbi:hypothetical protein DID75_02080 [Candidatus Marinamargulisbacteria bacterium SCGC AG-410-N11]|nr:hypothetical protein DID75_02080 [Candidatus Marinamargulisbacteria bacterium SCGC AG-410-N11]
MKKIIKTVNYVMVTLAIMSSIIIADVNTDKKKFLIGASLSGVHVGYFFNDGRYELNNFFTSISLQDNLKLSAVQLVLRKYKHNYSKTFLGVGVQYGKSEINRKYNLFQDYFQNTQVSYIMPFIEVGYRFGTSGFSLAPSIGLGYQYNISEKVSSTPGFTYEGMSEASMKEGIKLTGGIGLCYRF